MKQAHVAITRKKWTFETNIQEYEIELSNERSYYVLITNRVCEVDGRKKEGKEMSKTRKQRK